jgi:hypothetical protein
MNVQVRFDLLDEFEITLGDMVGDIELATRPAKGDRIDISSGRQALRTLGLPPDMMVVGVEEGVQNGGYFVLLEDLYVDNAEAARPLIRALEEELGLFLVPYGEGLE